jgi:hypothetical protein
MRLKIKQEYGKSVRVQQTRATQHAQPIGMNAVHQHDHAAASPAREKPALQRRA